VQSNHTEAVTRFAMPAVASFASALAAVVRPYKARISDAATNGTTGGASAWSPPV
jgi:hypothetical protein